MPWNPSPAVAVARDAARALADVHKVGVRQVIIVYVLDDHRIGMASYGRDRGLCAAAGKIGDQLYTVARRLFSGRT